MVGHTRRKHNSNSRIRETLVSSLRQMTPVPAALVLLILALPPAAAHEIRPAIATFGIDADGRVELTVALNLEAAIAGIGSGHQDTDESAAAPDYNRLRALPAADLAVEFERFIPTILERIALTLDGRPVVFDTNRAEIPDMGDTALARISVITLMFRSKQRIP